PKTPGVPGGPLTSPAKAAPELAPTTASAQTAVASIDFLRASLQSQRIQYLLVVVRASLAEANTAMAHWVCRASHGAAARMETSLRQTRVTPPSVNPHCGLFGFSSSWGFSCPFQTIGARL